MENSRCVSLPAAAVIAWTSLLACFAEAQQPPAKNPFAGFGNTSLDRKNAPGAGISPFGRGTGTPAPAAPVPAPAAPGATGALPSATAGGIVLSEERLGHLDQGSGGQTMKMNDLQAVLANYGKPAVDTGPNPGLVIYEGARMDGTGGSARISYLMPLDQALAQLVRNPGIGSTVTAVAPGFPAGLEIKSYDIRFGAYNRLCLVVDRAKPVAQVVSLLLKSQSGAVLPPEPAVELFRDWHTTDYVNTVNRGRSGLKIRTWVSDRRARGYIIVHTVMNDSTTWFAPTPLVNLILHSLGRQLHR